MISPLKVFIGYDTRETAAVWTLANSILKNTRTPIQFTFLHLPSLTEAGIMWRARDPKQSTDFTFSRFLVPYLCSYKAGPAIFMDCDMVLTPGSDIAELPEYLGLDSDVAVVKHNYIPKSARKFGGAEQTQYPLKLQSSLIVWNPNTFKCRQLTPKFINEADPKVLHRWEWTHPSRVAEIPEAWNWVPEWSGERVPVNEAKLIHFTEGSPSWKAYRDAANADVWWQEYKEATAVEVE